MTDITVDEIQRDPLKYLRQVEAGETLVIIRANQPIAEIRPVSGRSLQRPPGLCAGEFVVPDDFDSPLSDDLLHDFGYHIDGE